jgi:hypothetical protein
MTELSPQFYRAGYQMSRRLGINWQHLLQVMNLESGVDAQARNPAGAYGLIQITDLAGVGWFGSPEEFTSLSEEQQLPYVERYLARYAPQRLDSVRRIHQALFLPVTLPQGSARSLVLARANGTRWGGREASYYAANRGFDAQNKGYITAGDLEDADARAARSSRFQQILTELRRYVPESVPRSAILPALVLLAGLGVAGYGYLRRSR